MLFCDTGIEPVGQRPFTCTTSSRISYHSRRLFFNTFGKVTSRSFRRSSFPKRVTLAPPVRLQARSRRLHCATNLFWFYLSHKFFVTPVRVVHLSVNIFILSQRESRRIVCGCSYALLRNTDTFICFFFGYH